MHTYLYTQTLSPRSKLRLLRAAILLLATLELSAPFFLMNLYYHFHMIVHCESNLKLLLEIEQMKYLSFTYVYIDLCIYIQFLTYSKIKAGWLHVYLPAWICAYLPA